MNDSSMTSGRTARWAGAAGLLVAGVIGGGMLMGAAKANAATTTTTASTAYSSASSGTESTPSTRATYPRTGPLHTRLWRSP